MQGESCLAKRSEHPDDVLFLSLQMLKLSLKHSYVGETSFISYRKEKSFQTNQILIPGLINTTKTVSIYPTVRFFCLLPCVSLSFSLLQPQHGYLLVSTYDLFYLVFHVTQFCRYSQEKQCGEQVLYIEFSLINELE